jgi:hypothetical protein
MCKPSVAVNAFENENKDKLTTSTNNTNHQINSSTTTATTVTATTVTATATTSTKTTNTKLQNAKQNLQKGTLYACISLIMLISAFSLIMPYLQSRRDELQCDTLCQGSMTSARSTLSLIGSAVMGRLSDSKSSSSSSSSSYFGNGRILCLYIGTFATFLGFIIDASMYSIKGMWMGMIPGALLQQNFSIYKAMLADYHEEIHQLEKEDDIVGHCKKNDDDDNDDLNNNDDSDSKKKAAAAAAARASSVGKLGMSVGLAFMVGPLFGATMIKTYQSAITLASCLTILSTIWIMKMPIPSSSLISSLSLSNNKDSNSEKKETTNTSWKQQLIQMFDVKSAKTKPALFLIIIRASMALAFHIFNTIWTVSLKRRFDFGPSDHGKFMSYIGLIFALSQGFVAKRILAPFGQKGRVNIILLCCLLLGIGRLVAFQVNDLRIVYVTFGFIITSLGVVNTILTADTCLIAPTSEIGGVFGVLEAAQSAAGMVGPMIGGILAKIDPVKAPLGAVVGLYAFVFILVLMGYEKLVLKKNLKDGEDSKDDKVKEMKKEL